ncbi:hypothetical protein D9Q98_004489 [Chlorella vulgaris]|uniref:Uncharacterized protein n=1 Tax=Chlorella vulgaris TaxID=3077 RepID=A0A9D4TPY8_CHLVU|nr:hypothetical protein D9Q98_004489 [Chlorella vulgaris]
MAAAAAAHRGAAHDCDQHARQAAGDAKEAWLSISDNILAVTLPTTLLALALHGSLWGGAPPPAVVAAEAAVAAGAAIATATAVWKILEGFQGCKYADLLAERRVAGCGGAAEERMSEPLWPSSQQPGRCLDRGWLAKQRMAGGRKPRELASLITSSIALPASAIRAAWLTA